MSEQAHVWKLQLQELQSQKNISISFDGGALRSGKSLYTVHTTTANRKAMLVEGQDCSMEQHTGKWIANLVFRVRPLSFYFLFNHLETNVLLRSLMKLASTA